MKNHPQHFQFCDLYHIITKIIPRLRCMCYGLGGTVALF